MPEVHEFRYSAFISYRHADNAEPGRQWASWLHQLLETFTVPPELIGMPGARGDPVPASLFPVFLDRQELRADAALGVPIQEALRASRMLVVICTPRAVQSAHVAEEIRLFKHLGRADRILALIIAGEPFADDPAKLARDRIVPADECLPEPLRFGLAADGTLDRTQRVEPNFTDLRAESLAEGFTTIGDYRRDLERRGILKRAEITRRVESYRSRREEAELKLVAGVLGVPLGQLKPRALERQLRAERRKRRLSGAVAVAVLFFAAIAGVGWWQAQRAEAVSSRLVKWMREDMRNGLFQAGEVGLIAESGERIEDYFANRMSFGVLREAEGEFALQDLPMGEYALFLGRPDIAEKIYHDAFAAERHARMGVDFYHMQMARVSHSSALFALGRAAGARAELETALAAAQQARAADPNEPGAAWVLVEAQAALAEYALDTHASDADPEVAAAYDAVQQWAKFPHDPKKKNPDLKIAKGWLRLAAVMEKIGNADGIEKTIGDGLAALVRADVALPDNSEILEQLGLAHTQRGRLWVRMHDFDSARDELEASVQFLARAAALEPDSEALRHEWAEGRGALGDTLTAAGAGSEALACYRDRHRIMLELALHQSASRRWKFDLADAAIKLAENPGVAPDERSRLYEEVSWCVHELGMQSNLSSADQERIAALRAALAKGGAH